MTGFWHGNFWHYRFRRNFSDREMLVVESLLQLLHPLSMLSDVIEGENEKSQVNYQIL